MSNYDYSRRTLNFLSETTSNRAVIPPRYYIQAMRKLMIMGVGIREVWLEVTVLTGMTLLLLAAALKNFNKRLAV